jgi:hypothetical protein
VRRCLARARRMDEALTLQHCNTPCADSRHVRVCVAKAGPRTLPPQVPLLDAAQHGVCELGPCGGRAVGQGECDAGNTCVQAQDKVSMRTVGRTHTHHTHHTHTHARARAMTGPPSNSFEWGQQSVVHSNLLAPPFF